MTWCDPPHRLCLARSMCGRSGLAKARTGAAGPPAWPATHPLPIPVFGRSPSNHFVCRAFFFPCNFSFVALHCTPAPSIMRCCWGVQRRSSALHRVAFVLTLPRTTNRMASGRDRARLLSSGQASITPWRVHEIVAKPSPPPSAQAQTNKPATHRTSTVVPA